MTSIGKTPVIVSVANRPDIMFLVMGYSPPFDLWLFLALVGGGRAIFITFATSKSNMAGQERRAGGWESLRFLAKGLPVEPCDCRARL